MIDVTEIYQLTIDIPENYDGELKLYFDFDDKKAYLTPSHAEGFNFHPEHNSLYFHPYLGNFVDSHYIVFFAIPTDVDIDSFPTFYEKGIGLAVMKLYEKLSEEEFYYGLDAVARVVEPLAKADPKKVCELVSGEKV